MRVFCRGCLVVKEGVDLLRISGSGVLVELFLSELPSDYWRNAGDLILPCAALIEILDQADCQHF